jgi:hypothetical protein
MGLKFGDNITSVGQPLLPGEPAGYNGTDFDMLRSGADNADSLALATGGQNGGLLRSISENYGYNGASWDRIRSAPDNADALAAITLGALRVAAESFTFNGTTFDRTRGSMDNIVLANLSGATSSSQSADQTNFNGRGVKVFLNITANAGGSITFTIQGKDPVSGLYFTLLAGASQASTGTVMMSVYPGLTASTNITANDVLPRTWRLQWTIAGATVTATAGGMVLP